MTDLAIDPAVLTADTAANRLAELITHYADRNHPGPFDSDTWDEMVALAAAWRARAGWGADPEDFDRNETPLEVTGGGHDGYPIAGTLTEARAACAACAAVGAAVEAEWIGWPNSVRIEAVRAA